MAEKKSGYLVAGLGLLAVAVIGGWYMLPNLLYKGPKSWITGARATRTNGGLVKVQADVVNNGGFDGYIKVQALVVSKDCPYAGETGYVAGKNLWGKILEWIQTNPTKGTWLGEGTGKGWTKVSPGATVALVTPAAATWSGAQFASGLYNIFVNAAVATDQAGKDRRYANEYYRWFTNTSL